MKSFYLLTFILVAASFNAQACPEDLAVGNPVNYVHLQKEQIDGDWDFFNTLTTADNLIMDVVATATEEAHRISFRVTDSNLPNRYYLYLVEIVYSITTKVFLRVENFQRRRLYDDATLAADSDTIEADLWGAALTGTAADTTCCVYKLEYIHFYYLFTNYFKDGRGSTGWVC